ncbi:G domain-containing protein [Leclercia adecarboxylata]|uniref:GTPase family protein n=1 Tax=Leclercia adecarboxylata TaxID=83655 RepID=UPI0037DC1E56
MIKDFVSRISDLTSARGLLIPLDVALVGATGVGKSSTINSLFGNESAIVGTGVDPETKIISSYKSDEYFRVHDTPGLGDGINEDIRYAQELSFLLSKKISIKNSEKLFGYIDITLVILDGSSRDLGTTYHMLENIVLRCIEHDRVIVAINQADQAMKGRHWDVVENKPDSILLTFLEEKCLSIQNRIDESIGLKISKPVFYSAYHNYNIDTLMNHILEHLPYHRRS